MRLESKIDLIRISKTNNLKNSTALTQSAERVLIPPNNNESNSYIFKKHSGNNLCSKKI